MIALDHPKIAAHHEPLILTMVPFGIIIRPYDNEGDPCLKLKSYLIRWAEPPCLSDRFNRLKMFVRSSRKASHIDRSNLFSLNFTSIYLE